MKIYDFSKSVKFAISSIGKACVKAAEDYSKITEFYKSAPPMKWEREIDPKLEEIATKFPVSYENVSAIYDYAKDYKKVESLIIVGYKYNIEPSCLYRMLSANDIKVEQLL